MYKDILRGIVGIEVWPVLSLVIFVTFFAGVLVWVARLDRHRVAHLSALPLDGPDGDGLPDAVVAEGGR
jgi:hypothetical protein